MRRPSLINFSLCTAAFLSAGSSAGASVLAYNFAAEEKKTGVATDESGIQSGENTDALNDVADLYEDPVWKNLLVAGSSGSTAGTDSSTAVTVTWNAGGTQNGSSHGEQAGDASQQVFYQSLTDQDGGGNSYNNSDGYGATIQLSGLSALMNSTSQTTYSLVIFLASSTNRPLMGVPQIKQGNLASSGPPTGISSMTDLGSFTVFSLGDGTQPIAGFSSTSSDDNGIRGLATITGLTANAVTIAMPATEDGSQRTSIAGFAVITGPVPVPAPEPGAAGLAALGTLALLRRRRR